MPDQDQQLKYRVPFVIWANYDIEEEYVEAISVNYISSYLLKLAGLKGTVYNSYLMQLYDELPVINALFYMDKENRLYPLADDYSGNQLLQEYKYVGFNNALDKKNKLKEYYYLDPDGQ